MCTRHIIHVGVGYIVTLNIDDRRRLNKQYTYRHLDVKRQTNISKELKQAGGNLIKLNVDFVIKIFVDLHFVFCSQC